MPPSPPPLVTIPIPTPTTSFRPSTIIFPSNPKFRTIFNYRTSLASRQFPPRATAGSGHRVPAAAAASSSSSSSSSPPLFQSDIGTVSRTSMLGKMDALEEEMEKAIYRCRFMAFLGVLGSLFGSVLCFVKGCTHVVASFAEYFVNRGKVIMLLVEAIDVYLLGTVMLVFGMGLYELFISHLGSARSLSETKVEHRSNLFGLFTLKERPQWLDITTVNELKTKLGHVIVMLLLIGFFDKSKKAVIQSPGDLLCLAVSVFLSSGSLFLLSKLTDPK